MDVAEFCESQTLKARGLWVQIAACLPNRSVMSCVDVIRRKFVQRNVGAWTQDEVEKLRQLHAEMGSKWNKIGAELNRYGLNCRDKWRILMKKHNSGAWSAEESSKLMNLIKEEFPGSKDPPKEKIPWAKIAVRMKRTHEQCRHHWYRTVRRKITNNHHPMSTVQDTELIRNVLKQDPECRSDINFSSVSTNWTRDMAADRFDSLLKRIPQHSNKSFAEILGILNTAFLQDDAG